MVLRASLVLGSQHLSNPWHPPLLDVGARQARAATHRGITLARTPASGTPAAVFIGRFSGDVMSNLHMLLRPTLGASVRFASTEASTTAAGVVVVPSAVLIKVGYDSRTIWNPFEHKKLLSLNRYSLLKALKVDEIFGGYFKGVDKLSACSIAVIKNTELPVGVMVPPIALETGDTVVEMEGVKTVGNMAKEVGVSGAPLFIRVGLPTAAAVLPIFPPLPVPIVFKPIVLDGKTWFVTHLARGVSVPVFLTTAQHAELERFIGEAPNPDPQVLMPVGTIKSGKSTIVRKLLPGMIAAAMAAGWPSTRLRPVLFQYVFPLGRDAKGAAAHLQDALFSFGKKVNVPFTRESTPASALNMLPSNIGSFAECIRASGGELWLLLDEVQGPGLGSTPAQAQLFTHMFKEVSELCAQQLSRHTGVWG